MSEPKCQKCHKAGTFSILVLKDLKGNLGQAIATCYLCGFKERGQKAMRRFVVREMPTP